MHQNGKEAGAGKRKKSRPEADGAAIPNASRPGVLYIVATPIGNLEDITLRAARILGQVALVAAEDTRQTRKILAHLGVSPPVISYYKQKEASRAEQIIDRLRQGQDVALVSDAGTPGIADPGAVLIARAAAEGITVTPIPGACALVTAISAVGLVGNEFSFHGFLPARAGERRKALTRLAGLSWPIVFYETPHRILGCLADCQSVLGDRQATAARELTKLHEEIIRGPLSQIIDSLASRDRVRGEFVVMVAAALPVLAAASEVSAVLARLRGEGCSLRDAVRQAAAATGAPRKEVYAAALALWE